AEIGAFMDVVTGGRFLLGVGLGYPPEEFAIFGVPINERASRLAEGGEIIRRLWAQDRVTPHGRHRKISDVARPPRPLHSPRAPHRGRHGKCPDAATRRRPRQPPRPPILIGAQVEAAIARAAKISDGWLVVPQPKTEELPAQMKLFRDTRAAAGLPESPHVCRLYEVACAKSEDEAFRRAAPHLMEKYAAYASWGLAGVSQESGGPPEEQLRRLAAERFAVGTPAQVADDLVAQHRVGITHLSMRVSWPGMPQDDILAGIEILGRAVLPEVRRRTA